MKLNKLIILVFVAGSLLAVQSCSKIKNFGDINSNPNLTTSPNTAALLTNVESGLGNSFWSGGGLVTPGALYCQYNTETQYTEASRYQTPSFNWDAYYYGSLEDLQNIINYNTTNPDQAAANGDNVNQIAIARILKAYYFWFLTDSYGDLPYFNALKGNGLLAYDGQDKIYPDLVKELTEAVAQFVTPVHVIVGDILYGGDISKWKKFANSIRLLIDLRMSKKGGNAKTDFVAALNDPAGVITNNSDNAALVYPGGVYNNPVYGFYYITQRYDYGLCKTVTDFINANGDKRTGAFETSSVGFPYGLPRDSAVLFATNNPNWSYVLSSSSSQPTSPAFLITAANVWLARADAANLGWTSEDVATMYSNGISASWQQWGVYDAASFATYISSTAVSVSSGNIASKIGTQTWLAFYPNGWQGWSNWRRTGYPVLNPVYQSPLLPIPRRIPYGPLEPQLNPDNYTAAAANYTVGGVPNSQDARIWWDQ